MIRGLMNKIAISHIGLTAKDQMLLRNLCRLSSTVMGQFTLVDDPNSPQGDVLLINTQAERAEQTFKAVQQFKQFRSIIALQDTEQVTHAWLPSAEILTRPMVLRRVTKVFERLVNQNRLESESSTSNLTILVVEDSMPVRCFAGTLDPRAGLLVHILDEALYVAQRRAHLSARAIRTK